MGVEYKFSKNSPNSEELKMMALRFFSFDEKFWVARTKDFMEYSGCLRQMRDDIDEMIMVMQNGKLHNTMPKNSFTYGFRSYAGEPPLTQIQEKINEYSMEFIWQKIFQEAERQSRWGSKIDRKLPNVEAIAWIAYFAKYDERAERYVPSQNWFDYCSESRI